VRLLVISQYFWPEDFRINDLVAEMVARGHEVTVLTGLPNYPQGAVAPEFRSEPAAFARYRGARVVRVPLIARGRSRVQLVANYLSFAFMACICGPWRLRGLRFDAIFVFEVSPVTVGVPAVMLRALKRAPLAFWVLDQWPETLAAIGLVRKRWLLSLVGKLVSWIYHRCDLLLAPSQRLMGKIAEYCRPGARIEYFPNWADAAFDASEPAPAPEVRAAPGTFSVMFAGNLGEAQDLPALLDAAERVPADRPVRWLIVGDGRMAQWCREQIAARNLAERVQMLGRYAPERMPSFYRCADVLLLSLRDEPIFEMTIPAKLQSYLAAGRPVIAMLNGEGAEVVRRARAGISCPAGDSAALAAAVCQLAALTPEARAELGRNALALSTAEFGRAALISRLEVWLATLARGLRAGGGTGSAARS
jgi:colanic acid biosynthesis glycosyl transferase WcaI